MEFDLGEHEAFIAERLDLLIKHLILAKLSNGGGRFKNDIFEIRPYYSGDCTCGAWSDRKKKDLPPNAGHAEDCAFSLPNFRCGDISVSWHHRVGRGMSINRIVSKGELIEMFNRCFLSVMRRALAESKRREESKET